MFDIGKSFRRFVDGVFPNYRGVILERKDGGYVCLGKFCPTKNDVDLVIDEHLKVLSSSLDRLKTQP